MKDNSTTSINNENTEIVNNDLNEKNTNSLELSSTIIQLLIELNERDYDSSFNQIIEYLETHDSNFVEILIQIIVEVPYNFYLYSLLIIDISSSLKSFGIKFSEKINFYHKKLVKDNDALLLVSFYRTINILEFVGFFKPNQVKKFLNDEEYNQISLFVTGCKSIQHSLKGMDFEENKNFEFDLENDIFYSDELKKELINLQKYKKFMEIFGIENGDFIVSKQIIDKFSTSYKESCFQFYCYFQKEYYDSLILSIINGVVEDKIDLPLYIYIFKKMGMYENFLTNYYDLILKIRNKKTEIIDFYDKIIKFINISMAFIFENFHNLPEKHSSFYAEQVSYRPENDKGLSEMFKSLLNPSIINEMMKISNSNVLIDFLPPKYKNIVFIAEIYENTPQSIELKRIINENDFEKLKEMDKKEFYKAFMVLASPSISHFLTYFEILKNYFVMNSDEQRIFCTVFIEYFNDWNSYKRIVCEKLIEAQFIEETIAKEFLYLSFIDN
ncbi:hypothetical protein CWI36_2014p0010 [Hamiltosporidium magnivora]|uniref:Uncharacterized protein n=1 Tax=Hamiltosporidium magnivora TaxID=148818 RepID=A0A4Q9KXF0_9MICR|nr:hypothetical protein CWI36_2014p0010 [Hamiltosporidium magnivora]